MAEFVWEARARTGELRKGTMEAMPVEDASIDVIISNCVVNLSPDKDAVFREAFRVLRPGGRVHISDVVLFGALTPEQQANFDLWAGCVSGALEHDDYIARLRAAGFEDGRSPLAQRPDQRPSPRRRRCRQAVALGQRRAHRVDRARRPGDVRLL